MKYLVLFDREHHDSELLAAPTPKLSYDQFRKEFDDGNVEIVDTFGYVLSGERIVFLVTIEGHGTWQLTRDAIQNVYDELAVEGHFNIVGCTDINTFPIVGVDPLA